jgi:hypothetical protein
MEAEQSLLVQFIKKKKESYEEPIFKGRQTAGFSAKKYNCSLLTALSNDDQKEIAEAYGVGHSLLRKWRTEEPYKRVEQKHIEDFVNFLTGYTEKEIYKIARTRILVVPLLLNRLFEDFISLYGKELRFKIIKVFTSKDNLGDIPFYAHLGHALSLENLKLITKNPRKIKILDQEIDLEFGKINLSTIQDVLISISTSLQEPKLSKKEREGMADNLKEIAISLSFFSEDRKGKKFKEVL